ncbi:MAG: hypothetical protein U0R49_10050 [Fimbriimonadales bacterium]
MIAFVAIALICAVITQTPAVTTYTQAIRPLLERKCIGCHYEGGPSPFSFQTYAQAKARAELIKTVAMVRSMPPTDADSRLGSFTPIQPLTSEETVAIQNWIRQGLKEGPTDSTPHQGIAVQYDKLPLSSTSSPIRISAAKGTKTRSEGLPYWQVTRVPFAPTKDFDVGAFRVRPKTPLAVRQVQVYVDLYDIGNRLDGKTTNNSLGIGALGLLGTWSPGYYNLQLPTEAAITVPKSKNLIVQTLYIPTGKPEDAELSIEMVRAPTPQTLETKWLTLGKRNFSMPWAFEYYTLSDERTLKNDTLVTSLLPEARAFATQIRVTVTDPSGKTSTLLQISSWNRFWVGAYNLQKPVLIMAGSKIRAEIDYDNNFHGALGSGQKTPTLYYGLSEKDEMCWVHVLCATKK